MPIALISQRESVTELGDRTDSLFIGMTEFTLRMGFTAVPVPNDIEAANSLLALPEVSFIILSGGGYVPKEFYLEPPDSLVRQLQREKVERLLFEQARNRRIPLLGICRGMHFINGCFGGKVKWRGSAYKPNVHHPVKLTDNRSIIVNSFHNSAIPLDCLATGLKVLAIEERAKAVEAFQSADGLVLGLQWHPDRPLADPTAQEETDFLIGELLSA